MSKSQISLVFSMCLDSRKPSQRKRKLNFPANQTDFTQEIKNTAFVKYKINLVKWLIGDIISWEF